MEQTKDKASSITWAKLYLVPQNDNHAMPAFITGILTQETATHYVLMKVIEEVETDEGWVLGHSSNMHFISKTYVWNCEVLAVPPQIEGFGETFTETMPGGLG